VNAVPASQEQNAAPRAPGIVGLALLHTKGVLVLFARTIALTFRGEWSRKELALQLFIIGNQSLPLVFGAVSFIGMIMVAQAGLQLQRFIGNLGMVGPIVMPLMIREFAPTIGGLMLATRVGAGIAAEIGSMKATEQIDALRMCRTDPVAYLVVPRFWASVIMTVTLSMFAIYFAVGAGAAIAFFGFNVNPRTFINLAFVDFGDVIVCGLKSAAYGAAIPIAASYSGMNAVGGAEGVGTATTQAVVGASTAVIALDLVISILTFNL
jgi:phospholipid/cholesterol/gamma-HCH transport system permease protein